MDFLNFLNDNQFNNYKWVNTWCAAGRDGGNKLHAVQLDVEMK